MSSIGEQFQVFSMTLSESFLRKFIRSFLKESGHKWTRANDSLLMLDKEGMEKTDKDNVSKFLKSMGMMD